MTAPAPPPRLLVSVEATLRLVAEIDLVAYFTHLYPADRADYVDCEIGKVGYTEDHERPLAHLVAKAVEDAEVSAPGIIGDGVLRSGAEISEVDARVTHRSGERSTAAWSRTDYDALCDAVTWLAEHRAEIEPSYVSDLAWPHLSRVPGPLDEPLIGETA